MTLFNKKEVETTRNSELFSYSSHYISDELELIQDQQDNLVTVAEELNQALSKTENIKKLLKIVKKADKTILQGLGEKRKEDSSMINMFEEIKTLLSQQRYEDIDRLMLTVRKKNQLKVTLSKKELDDLKNFMVQIDELYKEAAGLCRLYQLVYSNIKQAYDNCQKELTQEISEEEELNKAGSYTERIH